MPKRRTEDVVHVAVTDHLIQRRKPGRDLLAALQETEPEYHGDVALYDPPQLPQPDRDLYLGIALVKDGADRPRGIALLEKALAGKAGPVGSLYRIGRGLRVAAESTRRRRELPEGTRDRSKTHDGPVRPRTRAGVTRRCPGRPRSIPAGDSRRPGPGGSAQQSGHSAGTSRRA